MANHQAGTTNSNRYRDWLTLFDSYQVQYLVLDSQDDRGLLQAAQSDPKWQVDCQDGKIVLLARVQASQHSQAAA